MLAELSGIVKDLGHVLLRWRDQGQVQGIWDGTQFKAKADIMAHEILVGKLRDLLPAIPVISEEDQNSLTDTRPECYWLIDPIDGTASFAHGYTGFVTQIALIVEHAPMLAAIYAPALDSLYSAERGRGAFLNDVRLLRDQAFPPRILIDNYPQPRGVALLAYNELHFAKYIECGSISLKICKVADGTADLFFKDVAVRDWDLAAAQLVLEETGGFLTDIYGHRIEYTGSYEQTGVVAASHPYSVEHLVDWYANLIQKD